MSGVDPEGREGVHSVPGGGGGASGEGGAP